MIALAVVRRVHHLQPLHLLTWLSLKCVTTESSFESGCYYTELAAVAIVPLFDGPLGSSSSMRAP